jgi:hypothetical protein
MVRSAWSIEGQAGLTQRSREAASGFNWPLNGFATTRDVGVSSPLQSMQRNFRPPLLTTTNRIGLSHLGQMGGGVFLAIRTRVEHGASFLLTVTIKCRGRGDDIRTVRPSSLDGQLHRGNKWAERQHEHAPALGSQDRWQIGYWPKFGSQFMAILSDPSVGYRTNNYKDITSEGEGSR